MSGIIKSGSVKDLVTRLESTPSTPKPASTPSHSSSPPSTAPSTPSTIPSSFSSSSLSIDVSETTLESSSRRSSLSTSSAPENLTTPRPSRHRRKSAVEIGFEDIKKLAPPPLPAMMRKATNNTPLSLMQRSDDYKVMIEKGVPVDKKSSYPGTLDDLVAHYAAKYNIKDQREIYTLLLDLLPLNASKTERAKLTHSGFRFDAKKLYDNAVDNPIFKLADECRRKLTELHKSATLGLKTQLKEKEKAHLVHMLTHELVGLLDRPVRTLEAKGSRIKSIPPYVQSFSHVEHLREGDQNIWVVKPGTLSSEIIKKENKAGHATTHHASLGIVQQGEELLMVRSSRSSTPELVKQKLIYGAASALALTGGNLDKASGFHKVKDKDGKDVYEFRANLSSALDQDLMGKGAERDYIHDIQTSIGTLFAEKNYIDIENVMTPEGPKSFRIAKPLFSNYSFSSAAGSKKKVAQAQSLGVTEEKTYGQKTPSEILERNSGMLLDKDRSYFEVAEYFANREPLLKTPLFVPNTKRSESLRTFCKAHWKELSLQEKCSLMHQHIELTGCKMTNDFGLGEKSNAISDDYKRWMLKSGGLRLRVDLGECLSGKDRTGAMAAIKVGMQEVLHSPPNARRDAMSPQDLENYLWTEALPVPFTRAADTFIADVIRFGNGLKKEEAAPQVKWIVTKKSLAGLAEKMDHHGAMELYIPHKNSPIGITERRTYSPDVTKFPGDKLFS